MGGLTSVILLLLVVVAQVPLSLLGHPSFSLHHLVGLAVATLVALRCIKVLDVGSWIRARGIGIAH